MKFTLTNDQVFASLMAMQQLGAQEIEVGSVALKVARITRALRVAALDVNEQRDKIRRRYALVYGPGHEHAGEIVPVWKPGTPEAEQMPEHTEHIVPMEMTFTNETALLRALVELGNAPSEIDCPALSEREVEVMRAKPNVIEAILWNIDATALPP